MTPPANLLAQAKALLAHRCGHFRGVYIATKEGEEPIVAGFLTQRTPNALMRAGWYVWTLQ